MDLSLSADQTAILDALDALARPYASAPLHDAGFALTSAALDRALQEGGFLDVGLDEDLGIGTAALIVERLTRLPQATPLTSAIIAPLLGVETTAPICLIETDKVHRPVRFLAECARVVVVGDAVTSFITTATQIRAEPEALFAYPVGTLLARADTREQHDIAPETLRTHWRIALATEAAGLLAAALESVCAHTSERQQFGRPLASFQSMRHRLAECQVRTNTLYWLAMKAAHTLDPADAALAALHAQESTRVCVYDFHQFMGAMGMSLEHPLHLWTYRLKYLFGELGGRGANALAVALSLWG